MAGHGKGKRGRSQGTAERPERVVCREGWARVGVVQSHVADGQRGLSWALGDVKPNGLILSKGIQKYGGFRDDQWVLQARGLGVLAAPEVTIGGFSQDVI